MVSVEVCAVPVVSAIEAGLKAHVGAGVAVGVQGSVASPIKGTATLTDAQAADLAAGKWYFNVHTEANKGGEIRGQVAK